MISFLVGTIAAKTMQAVYLNVNGVGFEVFMTAADISKLPDKGEEASVFTYLQVREDAMVLYGFLSQDDKALFEKLIGVSGVGPKVALAALNFYSSSQLIEAIMSQDVNRVQKIPGVGKKTASRIILELKGSLDAPEETLWSEAAPAVDAQAGMKGAVEALLSMGFTEAEAELALKGADAAANESVLLQYALKRLGSLG